MVPGAKRLDETVPRGSVVIPLFYSERYIADLEQSEVRNGRVLKGRQHLCQALGLSRYYRVNVKLFLRSLSVWFAPR